MLADQYKIWHIRISPYNSHILKVQVLKPKDYITQLLHHLLVFDFQGLDVGVDLKQPGMEEVEPPSQLILLLLHRGLADYLS